MWMPLEPISISLAIKSLKKHLSRFYFYIPDSIESRESGESSEEKNGFYGKLILSLFNFIIISC